MPKLFFWLHNNKARHDDAYQSMRMGRLKIFGCAAIRVCWLRSAVFSQQRKVVKLSETQFSWKRPEGGCSLSSTEHKQQPRSLATEELLKRYESTESVFNSTRESSANWDLFQWEFSSFQTFPLSSPSEEETEAGSERAKYKMRRLYGQNSLSLWIILMLFSQGDWRWAFVSGLICFHRKFSSVITAYYC